MNFWFTSDSHANHKNLVRGTSVWDNKEKCRDFDTIEEHDEILIQNINNVVRQNDILWHCGDVAMGGYDNVYKFRKRLICKTIHLLLGNHDNAIRNNKIIQTDGGYINIQNLFTTVDKLLFKKINGQDMVLCHFPLRSWENGSKGSWMIHGHTHGTLSKYKDFKQLDVGIDNHPEFRPHAFEEIQLIMADKVNLNVDHH